MPPSINSPSTTPPSNSARGRLSRLTLALPLFVCLLIAGCGGADTAEDEGSPAAGADPAFPVSVLSGPLEGGEEITVDAKPTSIVSLSPTATEMLWAIGADEQVVAVDDQSDYPDGVPTTELSGFEPNLEAILGYEPDLVVASGDSGDLVSGLEAAEVPTLLLPAAADLDEMYSQMERLGAATGNVADATTVVAEVRTGIEQAVSDAPDAKGLTYFHELGPDLYTATGNTFIGEVYGLFDLTSIADAAGVKDEYPQLSSEYVVSADPDFVFLADNECCEVTPEQVSDRPGWERMAAIDDEVHIVNEDITSRWGPRVVDFVQAVSQILAEHESQTTG
ncbi:MAG TPA: ABC transporter substrate-binding protein [Nocardioides sp.]|nr:ABC transporter substrate-binding protein [Nocardioides sp.]